MNARMIRILKYLNKERMASFKEIAGALDLKERAVRYDVDGINDELSLAGKPEIEKYPKGMLMVPDDLDLTQLLEGEGSFVFAPEEREKIVLIYVLFGIEKLNLRKLTDELMVSRRSIQNDLEAVQTELEPIGMRLVFDKKYYLEGESAKSYRKRVSEMKSLVPVLTRKGKRNGYETYITQRLQELYGAVSLERILDLVHGIMDRMGWVMSDESYSWYIANILTFTWYVIRKKDLPQEDWSKDGDSGTSISEFEEIVGRELTEKERGILRGFMRYTSRYVNLDINLEMVRAEELAKELVEAMSRELHIDFAQDGVLFKGLLDHLPPLLERIRGGQLLEGDAKELVPEGYRYIYETMEDVLSENEVLSDLTENEIIYLAVYFMGSLRRMQRKSYKTVLLVCGFGYGTTAMIRDALISEYQVVIKESIPAYRVESYDEWEDVDCVISTVKMMLPVEKPFAQVNAVFDKNDYVKLEFLGLARKNVLTDYLAIERRLDFLNDDLRRQVMKVVREELGFKEIRATRKLEKLSDLLTIDEIVCADHVDTWQEAIQAATRILQERGKIEANYYRSIIRGIEVQGFYSVTNHKFALLHGKESEGVHESCMSLIISQKPVLFGEKEVRLIFCLASRDKKEHVPAVVSLVRMAAQETFIQALEESKSPEEAMEVIRSYELK